MKRNIEVEITPSVTELAAEIWELDSDEQAQLLSELAVISKNSWVAMQLQGVSDSECLTSFGRRLMQKIGEYGEVMK